MKPDDTPACPWPAPRARVARACLGAALLLALGGCGALLESDYSTPQANVPAQWTQGPSAGAAPADGRWWENFGDPRLDRLVEGALARNNDLAAAAIRVRRAQLEAGLAEDQMFPFLSADANVGRDETLRGPSIVTRTNSVNLTVSYEADLWGRLARQRDAAQWEALATEQDRQSAALSLIGTTAEFYWRIAHINQRLETSRQSIEYARRTLELVQAQYDAGGASGLEMAEARQNLASQQAAHTLLRQQRVEFLNGLAILFDGPPGRVMADPPALPAGPVPGVRAGVPADVLARRPDLRAAELRLRASLATADATRAGYYPPLTLTGALGGASSSLSTVLQNPVATLGAGIVLPFLQWNEMRLSIRVSEADYEIAVVNFRQALYQALADVENALAARRHYEEQNALLRESLRAAREAESLYEVRYRAGAVALRFWLDAQEKRRNAEVALAENELNRLLNQVDVYLALGGDDQPAAVPAGASGQP